MQEGGHSHHVDERGKSFLVVTVTFQMLGTASATSLFSDIAMRLVRATLMRCNFSGSCANLCEGQWPFSSEPDFSACPSQSFSTGSTFAYRPQVVFLSFA